MQAREGPVEHGRKKIRNVGIDEEASFLCSRCSADPKCFVCHSGKLVKGEAEAHGHLNGDRSEAGSAEKKVTTNGDAGPNATGNQADRVGLEEQAEEITGEQDEKDDEEVDEEKGPLRFRCFRCKQEAHYEHCKLPDSFWKDRADNQYVILSLYLLLHPRSPITINYQPIENEINGNVISAERGCGQSRRSASLIPPYVKLISGHCLETSSCWCCGESRSR